MNKFFYPKSVAVIGVSDAPTNRGRALLQNLIKFEFKGDLYAVGLESNPVFGKTVYPSVLDIPGEVELGEADAIFYVLPYSSAWPPDRPDYKMLLDFCRDVNAGAKIPVFIYVDFDTAADTVEFYKKYPILPFNSISGAFKAARQVRDARKRRGGNIHGDYPSDT